MAIPCPLGLLCSNLLRPLEFAVQKKTNFAFCTSQQPLFAHVKKLLTTRCSLLAKKKTSNTLKNNKKSPLHTLNNYPFFGGGGKFIL